MLECLPQELCHHVVRYLPAPDVMTCLQLNRTWADLGGQVSLWRELLLRDADPSILKSIDHENNTILAFKKAFLVHAHACTLSSVKWYPLQDSDDICSPDSREGHLMCVLGSRVFVTGGFCTDPRGHVLNLKPSEGEPRRWTTLHCRSNASYVYGASLTALDNRRAVRFGGFEAGGYMNECNHVYLLVLVGVDGFRWKPISTKGSHLASPRAYHSATLIHGRYLVIIGGMKSGGSILKESILDTQTWTWLPVTVSHSTAGLSPSGRHGHSTVFDADRNRLVVFGGGSGSDLLRSGVDNSEVWELKFGSNWETDFQLSFPWEWRIIYKGEGSNNYDGGKPSPLSKAQALCLGRCHVGAKVSRDSVVLACGSGRPPTNGLLGFNLASDSFVYPQISGFLPHPRFTAASAVIGVDGWIVIHGGYSVQEGALGDTVLLDVAPSLKRSFEAFPEGALCASASIREADFFRVSRPLDQDGLIFRLIMSAPLEQRQDLARRFGVSLRDNT